MIWLLGGPLAGDDTDGHVDQLTRFVSPHEILVAVTDDTQDINYPPLQTNLQRFLDRQVIGLPAHDIVWGMGAFHCLTQQQPAGG